MFKCVSVRGCVFLRYPKWKNMQKKKLACLKNDFSHMRERDFNSVSVKIESLLVWIDLFLFSVLYHILLEG